MAPSDETAAPRRLLFDAVLKPHRSLSPTGFWVLMTAIAAVSFAAGAAFWLAGAWPVVGFLGLDVLLIYVAFRLNYRSAMLTETVELSESSLVVRRYDPGGGIDEWAFQPYWLRVAMDDPPRHESELALTSHGRRLAIGAFLTPAERLEVAEALRAVLGRLRNPFHD